MLIIEDGSARVDAQSYATAAELAAYAAARGSAIPATEAEQEALLVNALDYMETLNYVGIRTTKEQALAWPRAGAIVEGYYIGHYELPRQLKQAQMQLALDSQEVDLLANIIPSTEKVVVEEAVEGAVSVKYAIPTAPQASFGTLAVSPSGATLTRARALLRPLVTATGQLRVSRG